MSIKCEPGHVLYLLWYALVDPTRYPCFPTRGAGLVACLSGVDAELLIVAVVVMASSLILLCGMAYSIFTLYIHPL